MPQVKCRKGEPIDRAIKRLRRKMEKEETMDEFKEREYYVKPSLKRRRAAGLVR